DGKQRLVPPQGPFQEAYGRVGAAVLDQIERAVTQRGVEGDRRGGRAPRRDVIALRPGVERVDVGGLRERAPLRRGDDLVDRPVPPRGLELSPRRVPRAALREPFRAADPRL